MIPFLQPPYGAPPASLTGLFLNLKDSMTLWFQLWGPQHKKDVNLLELGPEDHKDDPRAGTTLLMKTS